MAATARTLYAEEGDGMSWEDVDDDRCYECTGYGDDYRYDDDGELVSNCNNCPHNRSCNDDWDD